MGYYLLAGWLMYVFCTPRQPANCVLASFSEFFMSANFFILCERRLTAYLCTLIAVLVIGYDDMNKLIDHMVESVQKSDMSNNDTELSSVDTAGMEQVAAGHRVRRNRKLRVARSVKML